LKVVEQAKGMIHDLEALLPSSPNTNFRERLVAQLEKSADADLEFRLKADALLMFYKKVFGVKDVVDKPDEE
jgi:hypothetical protein